MIKRRCDFLAEKKGEKKDELIFIGGEDFDFTREEQEWRVEF